MNLPLLQTKLFIPASHHLLSRPLLIDFLEEGRRANHRLILLSSSAGSGKTSLLSEWASQHKEELCWLSLDKEDNEPTRFWSYAIAALQRIQPGIGQNAAGLLDSPQPVPAQTILVALINDFVDHPKPVILVLDDYHQIFNLDIHTGISFLLEHLPPHISLVISTRADPPLPVVRLRAHNLLTEIREERLRFSAEEARSFFTAMGLALSKDDILAIETRTEGWIAGLQLVGLALKGRFTSASDPHPFISAFAGSQKHILDYLAEEVFTHLDKPVQDFLVKTSILERMCAGLCDEVVQISGNNPADPTVPPLSGRSILFYLERSNLFTLSIDENHQWFRYHHLFADLLSSRLPEILTNREIESLHCRASRWLAKNDLVDEAIRHAVLGKDFELAAALIEPLARAMMYSGRVNSLKAWIDTLPDDFLQSHLRLKIYAVWIDLLQGICELTQQKVQETEQLVQGLPASPENDQLKVELMVVMCRFIALSGNSTQAIQMARKAIELLSEGDLASRARVQSALAISYGLEGDVEQSETAFQACLRLARTSGYYSLAAHTAMVVGMGKSHYGRLREPARELREVIDLGMQTGRMAFPTGQGMVGLASIYLEWNDLDTGEKMLKEGIELCRQGGLDGVYSGSILKARLCQAKGDFKGALDEIQTLENSFQRKDHDTTARQVQALLAMGNVDAASRWLPPLTAMLHTDPAASKIPFLFLEVLKITLARILLARGELGPALQCLNEIRSIAEPARRYGHLIEVYTLKALALQRQNGGTITGQAIETLGLALKLAEPEGYILTFLEMGNAIVPLLVASMNNPDTEEQLKKYAGELLAAFTRHPGETPAMIVPKTFDETQDLSQREIEILRFIGAGFSNQEIAEHLFITIHTVKKHTSHIFAKLGVTSRTQAVAWARQAGLLQ